MGLSSLGFRFGRAATVSYPRRSHRHPQHSPCG